LIGNLWLLCAKTKFIQILHPSHFYKKNTQSSALRKFYATATTLKIEPEYFAIIHICPFLILCVHPPTRNTWLQNILVSEEPSISINIQIHTLLLHKWTISYNSQVHIPCLHTTRFTFFFLNLMHQPKSEVVWFGLVFNAKKLHLKTNHDDDGFSFLK